MILIGQYDSPFVRRVAIALTLYGFSFEHRPWSTFGEGDKIAPYNPLRRVPTLILDNGEVLIESATMLDYLDEQVGAKHALMAQSGPERQKALYLMALATGLADKGIALFYELVLHEYRSDVWVDRCTTQIHEVLKVLEGERAKVTTPFWWGDQPGHVDITLACVLRHLSEAHAGRFDLVGYPALWAHHQTSERLPVFQAIFQVFIPPK